MKKTITKTELRTNIYRSESGKRIQLGFWIDDEPYFLSYDISEFDELNADKGFETLCINAFLDDFKKFYTDLCKENNIEVYYRGRNLL